MDPTLPRARAVIDEGIADRTHIGAQLYVSLNGQPIADLAFGESRPGVAMTPDTVMLWLSACKPVTAVAVAQQWEQGRLKLDDRVADHLPEFGTKGKESVTIRHVLTHTCGFRWVETGWPRASWDEIIARICDAKQERDWVAGRRAGYSVYASWFILGEIVRRRDGREYCRYVREEVFEPLGMNDSWLAMPPEQYRGYGDRLGVMQKTEGGQVVDYGMDTEAACTNCRPSGSGHGPIRELGRFYEMLLNGGTLNGARILSPQTVEALTARHRAGMYDHTFNHVMDWGLGLLLNPQQYAPNGLTAAGTPETAPYAYGPHASPRTYGHGGNQSSAGFADPEHGLVVGVVFNGVPGEPAHQRRIRATLGAIYEDLGLVPA